MSTTEPAIPVLAAVPLASLQELIETAARDWPAGQREGAQVAFRVDTRGVSVAAEFKAYDWSGMVTGTRTYDGHWEASGLIRWTPRQ